MNSAVRVRLTGAADDQLSMSDSSWKRQGMLIVRAGVRHRPAPARARRCRRSGAELLDPGRWRAAAEGRPADRLPGPERAEQRLRILRQPSGARLFAEE